MFCVRAQWYIKCILFHEYQVCLLVKIVCMLPGFAWQIYCFCGMADLFLTNIVYKIYAGGTGGQLDFILPWISSPHTGILCSAYWLKAGRPWSVGYARGAARNFCGTECLQRTACNNPFFWWHFYSGHSFTDIHVCPHGGWWRTRLGVTCRSHCQVAVSVLFHRWKKKTDNTSIVW